MSETVGSPLSSCGLEFLHSILLATRHVLNNLLLTHLGKTSKNAKTTGQAYKKKQMMILTTMTEFMDIDEP